MKEKVYRHAGPFRKTTNRTKDTLKKICLRAIAAKVSDHFQNLVKAANNVFQKVISYVSHDICQGCLEITT